MLSKSELRRQMRETKRRFTPQQLAELSRPIVERLRERLAEAQTLVAYYPLPDEVDIRPLLEEWIAEGKSVFLPKVTGDDTMALCRYAGPDCLQEGAFHILEPKGHTEEWCGQVADLTKAPSFCLVPGVAFDAEGHRLGRGRGYYDRFLPSIPAVRTIGVCFPFQKVAEIPVEATDIPVDEVV